jgi:hypothetical protein
MDLETLKYPIGTFKKPDHIDALQLQTYLQTIIDFPHLLQKEVGMLSDAQLDTPYRPDGWTIRQVVHHCADSHMNAFIRFKLTLTEEKPTIRPYQEALWAQLADSRMPVSPSLKLIEGLHARMAELWKILSAADLQKRYVHPQYQTEYSLAEAMALYDWHSRHHLAHITVLKKQKGW